MDSLKEKPLQMLAGKRKVSGKMEIDGCKLNELLAYLYKR